MFLKNINRVLFFIIYILTFVVSLNVCAINTKKNIQEIVINHLESIEEFSSQFLQTNGETIEEGNLSGGFGSSILEYFSENNYNNYVKLFGIKDEFIDHGSRQELLDLVNLSSKNIYKTIKEDYEK